MDSTRDEPILVTLMTLNPRKANLKTNQTQTINYKTI